MEVYKRTAPKPEVDYAAEQVRANRAIADAVGKLELSPTVNVDTVAIVAQLAMMNDLLREVIKLLRQERPEPKPVESFKIERDNGKMNRVTVVRAK